MFDFRSKYGFAIKKMLDPYPDPHKITADPKIEIIFPKFFNFRSSNPGSGSGIRIRNPDPQFKKKLDPYPDPH